MSDQRECARPGCTNPTRNDDEDCCTRHEDRATYERYARAEGLIP